MLDLKYLKNVSTLRLDKQKCSGCAMCTFVCPHHVFIMNDKRARITDLDACMECGACAINCPENAILVQAGVGCAAAAIYSKIRKSDAPCCCDCSSTTNETTCC